ncbi:MAG: YjiH family protein [Helcococcus sp.]|nr:YjiH family protein [Helcococcus sp.]
MKNKKYRNGIIKFVLFSLIGVLLLMTPFKDSEGNTTVAVSVISKFLNESINKIIPIHYIILFVIFVSCLLSIIYKIFKPKFIENNKILKDAAETSNFWLVIKILGLIFCVMTTFKIGSEMIWSDNTGGLILYDLIGGLFTIFLVAGFILPFLTEFGLLEYIGVFLSKIMRPVFGLPGRSAVDSVASWIGDGTIGVTLTNKQYTEGYYTKKEASIIATMFSAVSITFCLVVLENVGLLNYFGEFYGIVAISGIVAALIIPRIPPLSLKTNKRLKDNKKVTEELVPEGYKMSQWALKNAVEKANENSSIGNFIYNAVDMVLGLWFGVIPIIMLIGTFALILSEYTSIFNILGIPFVPILKLLQVPEAELASQTMVVGFADMVVPSILAQQISSEFTRFVIAAVSVTQLIYMSETGAVILGSKIPVNLGELFIIFIERTLVTLPIIVLLSHLIF